MRIVGLALVMASLMAGNAMAQPKWAIVVHGGAGVIERADLTAEQELSLIHI